MTILTSLNLYKEKNLFKNNITYENGKKLLAINAAVKNGYIFCFSLDTQDLRKIKKLTTGKSLFSWNP